MAKKIVGYIKLQVPAGKANPSPPIGPALGQRGLNIMEFCKAFNAKTQGMEPGLPIPVVITAFADKSFTFIMNLMPVMAVVTNIDADHMETYGHDFGRLKQAFVDFLHRMPFYGTAILCTDDAAA